MHEAQHAERLYLWLWALHSNWSPRWNWKPGRCKLQSLFPGNGNKYHQERCWRRMPPLKARRNISQSRAGGRPFADSDKIPLRMKIWGWRGIKLWPHKRMKPNQSVCRCIRLKFRARFADMEPDYWCMDRYNNAKMTTWHRWTLEAHGAPC